MNTCGIFMFQKVAYNEVVWVAFVIFIETIVIRKVICFNSNFKFQRFSRIKNIYDRLKAGALNRKFRPTYSQHIWIYAVGSPPIS